MLCTFYFDVVTAVCQLLISGYVMLPMLCLTSDKFGGGSVSRRGRAPVSAIPRTPRHLAAANRAYNVRSIVVAPATLDVTPLGRQLLLLLLLLQLRLANLLPISAALRSGTAQIAVVIARISKQRFIFTDPLYPRRRLPVNST